MTFEVTFPDGSSLAGQIDVHAFFIRFKAGDDLILHMDQTVRPHIIPQRLIGSRNRAKGIVKGPFDVDRRIPVSGLFLDLQPLSVLL